MRGILRSSSSQNHAPSSTRSSRSTTSRHSFSGDLEFFDADDGCVSSPDSALPMSPVRLGNDVMQMTSSAIPQPGGEHTGSGEQGWLPEQQPDAKEAGGLSLEGDRSSDIESLDFHDARDPVSEVCASVTWFGPGYGSVSSSI